MQMVAVGMGNAGQNLAHDNPRKAARDRLDMFQTVDFEAGTCQNVSYLGDGQTFERLTLDPLMQPIV